MFSDAGLVALPPEEWGKQADPLRRNLYMRILRTPHNVVRESQPEHVANWGRIGVTPNGQVISLGDSVSDAIGALDRAGPRGAAALGAGAGFIFSSNRIMGALLGGVIGYFGGTYIVNLAKKAIEAQKVVSAVSSITTTAKAG